MLVEIVYLKYIDTFDYLTPICLFVFKCKVYAATWYYYGKDNISVSPCG